METLQFLPCEKDQFPSRCDVYIDGKLMFKDVFVLWHDLEVIYLYRSYRSTETRHEPDKMVAVVASHEIIVTARKLQ